MLQAEKIDVGWPDPENVSGYFAASMGATIRDMEYHGCMGKIHRVETSILTLSRNMMVEKFLAGDSEWLWTVDSDMTFDKGHPMKLWEVASEYNVKMVSGLAFMFNNNQPVPSIFYENPENPEEIATMPFHIPSEPMKVAATGLASSLIHRDVFEAMPPARTERYRWFDLIDLKGDGESLAGEDVQFFRRASKLGFDLMIAPHAETWHLKMISVGREDWHKYCQLQVARQEQTNEQPQLVINHDED